MIIDTHCHVWPEELLSGKLQDILISEAKLFKFDYHLILDGLLKS